MLRVEAEGVGDGWSMESLEVFPLVQKVDVLMSSCWHRGCSWFDVLEKGVSLYCKDWFFIKKTHSAAIVFKPWYLLLFTE